MQEQETKKKQPKVKLLSSLKALGKALFLLYRSLYSEMAWEQYKTFLMSFGASENDPAITSFEPDITAVREVTKDVEYFHRIDNYLVGGVGIVDLTLLSIILPMGTPDTWLMIALIALIISLPLAAGSLFLTFLNKENQIATYGRLHTNLTWLSLFSGVVAVALSIFHISLAAGIIFCCLALLIGSYCFVYAIKVAVEKHTGQKFPMR